MADIVRCVDCDRADCPRLSSKHGWDALRDCHTHAVNWRTRALNVERDLAATVASKEATVAETQAKLRDRSNWSDAALKDYEKLRDLLTANGITKADDLTDAVVALVAEARRKQEEAAEMALKNATLAPATACGWNAHGIEMGCGASFSASENNSAYRCVDCGVFFHRHCAREHFLDAYAALAAPAGQSCKERESLLHVDATPDNGYVARILQAHLDANTSSAVTDNLAGLPPTNPLCIAMNEAAAGRAKLLRAALHVLDLARVQQPDTVTRAEVERVLAPLVRLCEDADFGEDPEDKEAHEAFEAAKALLAEVKRG